MRELTYDRVFDNPSTYAQLATSIRRHGILEPLTVRYAANGEKWLDDGTHRVWIAQKLGMGSVPVTIIDERVPHG